MKVSNRKIIRKLSIRSMKASKGRNVIAVLAIALTTILFTALFTIALSVNQAFEEASFHEAGGYQHGTFKNVTISQIKKLTKDEHIKEYGKRLMVTILTAEPFDKNYTEISYADANDTKYSYLKPVKGRMPQAENEIAADAQVLSLLGIKPKLGTKVSIPVKENGVEVKEEFVLSGWWKHDKISTARMLQISEPRAKEIIAKLGNSAQDYTGKWALNVMLKSSTHVKRDMKSVLKTQGFQDKDGSKKNYIRIGVNWGYNSAKMANSGSASFLGIGALLLVIIFTGYLIIYNVFQISVTNDIRFYGLLKTIGTTGRQLKRIIRQQALALSVFGIPLGLLIGYFLGVKLTPVILSRLNGVVLTKSPTSPLLFAGASVFSLLTVIISCHKPGKIAAKVSPAEAVHYTEQTRQKKKLRKTVKGASIIRMAWANRGRSPKKTVLTILSLSLAVILLNLTATFTNGFDTKKMMRNMPEDFVISDVDFFQDGAQSWTIDKALNEDAVRPIAKQKGFTEGGSSYVPVKPVQNFAPKSFFDPYWNESKSKWKQRMKNLETRSDGKAIHDASVQGLEHFGLGKLEVIKGDLSKLEQPGNYVAAVYDTDDYHKVETDSNWAKVGDTITLRYLDEYQLYDPYTNQPVKEDAANYNTIERGTKYKDVDYQVVAEVVLPNTLDPNGNQTDYVTNSQTLMQDSGDAKIMCYSFDVKDKARGSVEKYMRHYTDSKHPECNYASQTTELKEYDSMKSMYTTMGSVLSLIIGVVGILNFLNAIITGILARRREFAVLQSIGMTGGQLKLMLIIEGLCYAFGAVAVSLLVCLALAPVMNTAISSIFWFFTYRFTIWPVLAVAPIFALLGLALPLISYRIVAKHSLVERLREAGE